jgi:hypothetical protein
MYNLIQFGGTNSSVISGSGRSALNIGTDLVSDLHVGHTFPEPPLHFVQ